MNQLFDDNTMNFIDLWSYIQERSWFEDAISPEDMVLINELVAGSNFDIALDMLRHRLHPHRKKIPQEFADVLKPAKCIKVRDTSHIDHLDGYTTHQGKQPIPGKTETRKKETHVKKHPRVVSLSRDDRVKTETWKVEELPDIYENARRRDPLPVALTDTDVSEMIMEERWERKTLRKTQEDEYQQSLDADRKKNAEQKKASPDIIHPIANDTPLVFRKEVEWSDALFTFFPTSDEVINHQEMETRGMETQEMKTQETQGWPMQAAVVEEPREGNVGVISVVVVLPSGGERVSRLFLGHHTLENISDWVKVTHGGATLSCFYTNFPRQAWSLDTSLDMVSQGQKRLLLFGEE